MRRGEGNLEWTEKHYFVSVTGKHQVMWSIFNLLKNVKTVIWFKFYSFAQRVREETITVDNKIQTVQGGGWTIDGWTVG